ncbi:hypothetical protein K503DRAFT_869541, partial [Rhizopogon vinicolor AM-OR11-026]
MLLVFHGGSPDDYWPYVFPAFAIGSSGTMLIFTHGSIAIFQAVPSSMAGTVGAIYNSALQFGSAIGIAVTTSIETSVEATHGGPQEYAGRAAAFWFLTATVAVQFISISVFYDRSTDHKPQPKHGEDGYPAHLSTESKEKHYNEGKVTMTMSRLLIS